MKKIISNAFAAKMLSLSGVEVNVSFKRIGLEEAKTFAQNAESSIGHQDAADRMSMQLGMNVVVNRRDDILASGDQVLLEQYTGPRLAEGTTSLPEGASSTWILVTVL